SIIETFGHKIYSRDGRLERRRLAKIVFADHALKHQLDQIVHPYVFSEIDRQVRELPEQQRFPYILIEAALIYETGMDKRLDRTIVVDAKEETRIKRVMVRDKSLRKHILNRIKSQMDVKKKLARADFIIVNDGTETELINRVKFIDRLLTIMASTE
ncbi:MAG: dephospho-CoA kinase, partial [Ignavibacteriae bacterium]|nr:dephospho-CoA kinase [Ignavibacteriota bacterium]